MLAILAGFVAGWIHVFSGPDHLAAVAPLSVRRHRRAWLTGFRWGLGHSAGVIVVGLAALLLRDLLPMEAISVWSERLVGVFLIGIGAWGLRLAFSRNLHAHEHEHDAGRHLHLHVHPPEQGHDEHDAGRHAHAAFGVGSLHGLAGSSHVLGVLPALALPTMAAATGYLAAYGIGTIVAMVMFSGALGLAARKLALTGVRSYRILMGFCAVAAIVIGTYWVVMM